MNSEDFPRAEVLPEMTGWDPEEEGMVRFFKVAALVAVVAIASFGIACFAAGWAMRGWLA